MKEKGVGVKGASLGGVVTNPSVATETQTAQPSSAVTAFFRSELWAIKENQDGHD